MQARRLFRIAPVSWLGMLLVTGAAVAQQFVEAPAAVSPLPVAPAAGGGSDQQRWPTTPASIPFGPPNRRGGSGENRVGNYLWTSGWTQIISYGIAQQNFLLAMKESGVSEDGCNVHLYRLRDDGSLGEFVIGYLWREGWSRVRTYEVDGSLYLLLMREWKRNAEDNSLEVHRINQDGTIDSAVVAQYSWKPGWTEAVPYTVQGKPYLLLLKTKGYDEADDNVQIRRIEANGSLGEQVAHYQWSEGWTTVSVYEVQGKTFLLLVKRTETDADGNNVRIYRIQDDGTVALSEVNSYAWQSGWSQVVPYSINGQTYLYCQREVGFDEGEVNRVNMRLFPLTAEGTIGPCFNEQQWTEGWSLATVYRVPGALCVLIHKRAGFAPDGFNVHIHRFSADGLVE